MSRPDEALVRKTAQLARLELETDECAQLAQDFATILDAFQDLQQVEVGHVAPMVRPGGPSSPASTSIPAGDSAAALPGGTTELVDVLRDDVQQPGLEQAQALANAPEARDGFFGVPRVLGDPS